jgi:N-acetylneuraminic acid mutarotase
MSEARQEVGVAELGGRIYVAGGFRVGGARTTTLEIYDPGSNSWSFGAPLPVALDHPAAASLGGRFYVFGGNSPSGNSSATYEYDPVRNSWGVRAPLPGARNAAVAIVAGSRIYVAGGAPTGNALDAYDPASDTWTRLAAMPTPRNHLAGGLSGGRLFVVGGRPPTTLATLEAYDVAAGTWAARAPMPTGRSGHAAAVVRGCLYAFGGEGNSSRPDGVFPQSEVYDPRTNAWESLPPMPTPRHGIAAAVIGDRIYLPGGATLQGLGAVATHEVFTAATGRTCE